MVPSWIDKRCRHIWSNKTGPPLIQMEIQGITRRERPKSAPYLRLKNIQGTTIGNIWKKNIFSKKSIW